MEGTRVGFVVWSGGEGREVGGRGRWSRGERFRVVEDFGPVVR